MRQSGSGGGGGKKRQLVAPSASRGGSGRRSFSGAGPVAEKNTPKHSTDDPAASTAAAAGGSWTKEEDALIMSLAAKELRETGRERVRQHFWPSVQEKHFPNRHFKQLSRRYQKLCAAAADGGTSPTAAAAASRAVSAAAKIDPVASATASVVAGTIPWTERDDELIRAAAEKELKKTGGDKVRPKFWPHIQKKHFPDRTFKQVSRRYRKLMNRKNRVAEGLSPGKPKGGSSNSNVKSGANPDTATSTRTKSGSSAAAMEIDSDGYCTESDDNEDNQNVCGLCRESLSEQPRSTTARSSLASMTSPPVGTLSYKQKARIHSPCCPTAASGVAVVVCANASTTLFSLSPDKHTKKRPSSPRQKKACPHPRYHLACSAIPIGSRLYRDAITDHYVNMCGGQCKASSANLKIARASSSPDASGQQKPMPQTQFDAEQILRGYLCPYCDVEGTSHYLVEYFEAYRKSKAKFCNDDEAVDKVCPASSQGRKFVEYVLRSASGVGKQKGKNHANKSKGLPSLGKTMGMASPAKLAASKNGKGVKKSEVQLEHIEKIMAGVATSGDAAVAGKMEGASAVFSPAFLVGQPIRLYNPIEDAYHVGRIVDWKTVPIPEENGSSNDEPSVSVAAATTAIAVEEPGREEDLKEERTSSRRKRERPTKHFGSTVAAASDKDENTEEGEEENSPLRKRGRSRKSPASTAVATTSTAIVSTQVESSPVPSITGSKPAAALKSNEPTSDSSNNDTIFDNHIGTTQYLVRFRAGVDGRKVPVHQWIFLEEHALSVGIGVVWADPSSRGLLKHSEAEASAASEMKESKTDKAKNHILHRPAQIIVRTALEMLPVKELNTENSDGKTRAMAYFFGREFHHAVLDLDAKHSVHNGNGKKADLNESTAFVAADFASPPPALQTDLREAPYGDDDKLATAITLASMEKEEQRRIRRFVRLPVT